MPDVITANRLTDGVVVFQTIDECWTEDFNRAAVLPDPEATARDLRRSGIDHLLIETDKPFAARLRQFCKSRGLLGRGAR